MVKIKTFPDQKEYLKKYLSGSKGKIKKRKEHKNLSKGVKLIDDDEAVRPIEDDDENLILDGEDAPQIILGEGVELSVLQDSLRKSKSVPGTQTNSDKPKFLKNFSVIDSTGTNSSNITDISYKKKDDSYKIKNKINVLQNNESEKNVHSAERNINNSDYTSFKENRKEKLKNSILYKQGERSRDCSSNNSSDQSPPRRYRDESKRNSKKKRSYSRSSDLSPQRIQQSEKRSRSKDLSPIRRRSAYSSQSKRNSRFCESESPMIPKYKLENNHTTLSPTNQNCVAPRRKREDLSPPRLPKNYCSPNSHESSKGDKIKMLDGKSAGLKNARELKEELKSINEREQEILKNSTTNLDQFSEPVIRTNVRSKFETFEEQMKNKKKEKENEKRQEVYTRWGKGLKQIEDHKAKIAEQNYESSKPLARYADDKDLDSMLKNTEREGDPMLEYLRSKKQKERANKKQPELPIYKGNYPENRFGIRPGYRWDGVDRSNGYEKKYFEKQNAKLAFEEEAYRYSTEDM